MATTNISLGGPAPKPSQRQQGSTRMTKSGVPVLVAPMVTVRPVKNADGVAGVVYGPSGPLPDDVWSTIPYSAGVAISLKHGDLEKAEEEEAPATPPVAPGRDLPPDPTKGSAERQREAALARARPGLPPQPPAPVQSS